MMIGDFSYYAKYHGSALTIELNTNFSTTLSTRSTKHHLAKIVDTLLYKDMKFNFSQMKESQIR